MSIKRYWQTCQQPISRRIKHCHQRYLLGLIKLFQQHCQRFKALPRQQQLALLGAVMIMLAACLTLHYAVPNKPYQPLVDRFQPGYLPDLDPSENSVSLNGESKENTKNTENTENTGNKENTKNTDSAVNTGTTTPDSIQLAALQHSLADLHQQWQHSSQQINHADVAIAAIKKQQTAALNQQQQHNLAVSKELNRLQQQWLAWRNTLQAQLTQLAPQTEVADREVEHFFRLVAVQGFSDGLRGIIDIDGHQTVLAIGQSCPACHGWRLAQLHFASQTAVFTKQHAEATLHVDTSGTHDVS